MGEVPIAVPEVSNASDIAVLKTQVQQRVERTLGVEFRPAKVFTVHDLGLDASPKHPTGNFTNRVFAKSFLKRQIVTIEEVQAIPAPYTKS